MGLDALVPEDVPGHGQIRQRDPEHIGRDGGNIREKNGMRGLNITIITSDANYIEERMKG